MFGYIRPMECELRVREQKEYRAFYCGLCKTLGMRYGQIARLALNYDCTFLAVLLTILREEQPASCALKRCAIRPLRGKTPVAKPSDAIDYAADVNVLLSYYQYVDDWTDERSLRAIAGKLLLKKSARRAAERHPTLAQAIKEQLKRLNDFECSRTACTDEPSDAFGVLLREIVLHAPMLSEAVYEAAAWTFYNLGRWIYLIDAWNDRQKDKKNGTYNPFLCSNMDADTASFLLYVSLTEAEKGFDLLPISDTEGLINNIMHLGCRYMTRQILGQGDVHESV